jgi:amidohydrolase
MHACGHDAHTSIGLGVAAVLSQMRGQIHGEVKLLFEPAEEGPPPGEEGGSRLMIKEGALEKPRPSAIFGLHVSPEIEVGKLGCRSGPAQASLDGFDITIRGKAAFVLRPEQGSDAVSVAAQCITALELVRSRGVSAFEPMLLNIGRIQGGDRRFSLAEEVKMEGCLRTLNEDVRQRAMTLLRQTLKGITEANNASFELSFHDITAVLNNDPALVAGALPVLRQTVGESNIVQLPQRLGGEDFSYFAREVPGCFFRLGCGNLRKGITAQIHSPDFDIDEECLVIATRAMTAVLMDYLNRTSQL